MAAGVCIGRGSPSRACGPRTAWSELKDSVVDNIEYGLRLDADDILDAEAGRADLHITMTTFFERYDILALPSTQVAPFPAEWEYPTEINGVVMNDYLEWMSACCVITPTGCPAISIPAGFTSGGLPVGVQLVAPIGHERRLLEVGAAIESSSDLLRRQPAL